MAVIAARRIGSMPQVGEMGREVVEGAAATQIGSRGTSSARI